MVRRYLEEEAKIDALESTSEELLLKLEMRKNAGTLDLDSKSLTMSLRAVLQNADLVKFAKSMPEYRIASEDRKVVEHVVIETQGSPARTHRRRIARKKQPIEEYLAKKRRKEQWIWGLSGVGLISLLAFGGQYACLRVLSCPETPLLGYPTKGLYQWRMGHRVSTARLP